MATRPFKPLTNQERIEILKVETSTTFDHLKDQEIEHFGSTRNTSLEAKFETLINPIGSFANKYDDYLLKLFDDQQVTPGVNITRGQLITTFPVITYAENIT